MRKLVIKLKRHTKMQSSMYKNYYYDYCKPCRRGSGNRACGRYLLIFFPSKILVILYIINKYRERYF